MKKFPLFYSLIIPAILLLTAAGCKKDNSTVSALISTVAATSIDSTSAISGGDIFSDAGEPIIERGVCWSSSMLPTINNSKTSDGQGIGSFSSSLSGLTKGTMYFVRAFATSSVGTTYGPVLVFTTLGAPAVSVITPSQTLEASNLTSTSATLNRVVDAGFLIGDVSFEYGLDNTYGLTIGASMGNMINPMPGSTPSMQVVADITGLSAYTQYHYRVIVNTAIGPVYGDDIIFMTTY